MQKAFVAVLIIVVGLALAALPVFASNFGRFYADNKNHYYSLSSSLHTDSLSAANWGKDRLDATDINVHDDGSCKSQTDVCIFDGDYSQHPVYKYWSGWVTCNKKVNSSKCDKWHMYFNTGEYHKYDEDTLRQLGCHEWGHTVGLRHSYAGSGNSCMWSPLSHSNSTTDYSVHDIDHIDGRY